MKTIKLLSWNILGPEAFDTPHFKHQYPEIMNWEHRFNLLIQKIISFQPNIICLQEVDEFRRKEFAEALNKQGFSESSFETKNKNGGVIIFHKHSQFDVIDSNNTQLPTEKSSGAAAWTTLQCKQTQQNFMITSLHLHWQLGMQQLETFTKALQTPISIPMIVTGDFNIPYKTMTEHILPEFNKLHILNNQQNFLLFEHESLTAQHPDKDKNVRWKSLDHVLFSKNIKINTKLSFIGSERQLYKNNNVTTSDEALIDDKKKIIPNDDYPSDHLPLITTFIIH